MTHNELKARIKDSMLAYLKLFGWPDRLSNREILESHLPGMWKKLEKEGLLKTFPDDGLRYKRFVDVAIRKVHEAELFKQFGFGFGR